MILNDARTKREIHTQLNLVLIGRLGNVEFPHCYNFIKYEVHTQSCYILMIRLNRDFIILLCITLLLTLLYSFLTNYKQSIAKNDLYLLYIIVDNVIDQI